MNKFLITILSACVVTLVSASCVNAQNEDRLKKFVPTELYACNYRNGQGPSELEAVIDNWTAYMNEQEVDTYTAWTLTRQYYTAEQEFDVLWLGAWKDSNAMGQGRDNYHATGGAIMAEFASVVDCSAHLGFVSRAFKLPADYDEPAAATAAMTFTDCTIQDGATYDTIAEAMSAWANTLAEDGSQVAIYQWWPVFGGGEADFDFKLLNVHRNHASLGADLERLANGELWRKRMGLLGEQIDCDVSRVYDGRLRRSSQLR